LFLTVVVSERLARSAAARSEGTTIFFDGACGFCRRGVFRLRNLMLLSATDIREAQSDPSIEAMMRARNSWIVRDRDGAHHWGYDAFVALTRRSVLTWWLAPALGSMPVRWAGERMYRWVASHRSGLSWLVPNPKRDRRER
jgi:predicted DCC family thiol-disulfide oxidoreductase YuxK